MPGRAKEREREKAGGKRPESEIMNNSERGIRLAAQAYARARARYFGDTETEFATCSYAKSSERGDPRLHG